jgi:hypothetical protein
MILSGIGPGQHQWIPSGKGWLEPISVELDGKTYSLQNAVKLGGQQQHLFSVEWGDKLCFAVEFGRSSIVS